MNYETEHFFGFIHDGKFLPRTNIPSGIIRVILLNKCNYACPHCFREGELYHKSQSLDPDFILRVVEFANKNYGVHTIKLSGGEPLIYKNLEYLLKGLRNVGIKNIDITSNGYFLREKVPMLTENNIKYATITLNTLNKDLYPKLHNSPKDALARVIDGILFAQRNGIKIRLNSVALDVDNQDIFSVIKFAEKHNIVMRICEPTHVLSSGSTEHKMKFKKIMKTLQPFIVSHVPSACKSVDYIKLSTGAEITVMRNLCDNRLCDSCGKFLYVRLTSDGHLKPCLSRRDTEVAIPLKPTDSELDFCFVKAINAMGSGLSVSAPTGLNLKC